MKKILSILLLAITSISGWAQDAFPTISYYNKKEETTDTLKEGATLSAEAPLDITLHAGVVCPSNYTYTVEWKAQRKTTSETTDEFDRFEEESEYTLTKDGTYEFTLIANFVDINGDTVPVNKSISITIATSVCTCPDAFSPNGDKQNDVLAIKAQSLVEVKGCIFNRWGQKIVDINLSNMQPYKIDGATQEGQYEVWNGYVNGKPAKDGVYFINIDARGSDGTHYKIKKAINVLKSLRSQQSETDE